MREQNRQSHRALAERAFGALVAFAVCTPPQITDASLTMSSFGCPVTVTSLPCTVVGVPTT